MITANVDLGTLLKRLRKVPREAAAIIAKAIEDDARGFVRDIIAITPPSMGKANLTSKNRGEEKVASDIRKAYGTASDLWRLIREKAGRGTADNFWAYMKLKRWHQANEIALRVTGKYLDVFDGGSEHQRRRNKRTGRVVSGEKPQSKNLFLAPTQDAKLKRYIQQQRARVGLLAAGFNPAASRLKASVPAWIKRHREQVGTISVITQPDRFIIIISNNARHGRANDLSRRMAYVLNSGKRQKRLQNSIRYGIRAALKKSQLTIS
jgi:hypothetical protein